MIVEFGKESPEGKVTDFDGQNMPLSLGCPDENVTIWAVVIGSITWWTKEMFGWVNSVFRLHQKRRPKTFAQPASLSAGSRQGLAALEKISG